MNTPIFESEMDPAEQKRRAAALKRAVTMVRGLGFREVAGKPGWWYHEQGEQDDLFALTTNGSPIRDAADVFGLVIFSAKLMGATEVRGRIKRALGL